MDIKKFLYIAGLSLFFNSFNPLEAIIVEYGNRRFDIFKENNGWVIASETKDGVAIAKNAYEYGHNFLVDLAITMEIAEQFKLDFENFQNKRSREKIVEILRQVISSSTYYYINLQTVFNDFESLVDNIFRNGLSGEIISEFLRRVEEYISNPYEKIFTNEKTAIHTIVGIIEKEGINLMQEIRSGINLANNGSIRANLINIYPFIGEHTINFENSYPNIYHEEMRRVFKQHPSDWSYLMFTNYINNNPLFNSWKKECKERRQSLINKIEEERNLNVRTIYDPERFKDIR